MRKRTRAGKAAAAGAAVGAMLVTMPAQPAAADLSSVQTHLGGGWWTNARAYKSYHGDIVEWSNFRIWEGRVNADFFDWSCGYQGQLQWESPGGQIIHTQRSGFHGGCSYSAWVDFQNYAGGYQRKTKFPAKWRSNHTPRTDWLTIGKLT